MPYAFVPAAAAAVIVAVYLFLIFPARCPASVLQRMRSTHFAHRGLHDNPNGIPENSLAALLRAHHAGFGAELDVNLSLDGQVVVFHDDTLSRMTGREGLVWDVPVEELSQLRLLGTDQAIPLFSELLPEIGDMPLVVELKRCPRREELCEKTLALLRSYRGFYCIESFDPSIVAWFRKNAPEVVRGQLVAVMKKRSGHSAFRVFMYNHMLLNFLTRPHFMACEFKSYGDRPSKRLCRRLGAAAVAWTCRSAEDHIYCKTRYDSVIFEHYDASKIT